MTAITPDDVRRIAHLARLTLDARETVRFAAELGQILDYVSRLDELDLDGIDDDPAAGETAAPLRDDEARPGLHIDEALGAAPSTERRHFIVPQVVGP